MPDLPSYQRIQDDLSRALRRAVEVEARQRSVDLPTELAAAVASGSADPTRLRAIFGTLPPVALLAFDTPGIQNYVFTATRPIDIRGGSGTISDLTDTDESKDVSIFRHLKASSAAVPRECVIYAGAGGGLLLVAACEADGVAGTLAAILPRATAGGLRTVCSQIEVWPQDLSDAPSAPAEAIRQALGDVTETSRYSATLSALEARRQRRRAESEQLPDTIAPNRNPERCQVCGGREATRERRRGDGKEKICGTCFARWRYGRSGQDEQDEPESFEQLLEGLPNEDLAVLYADGANMGRAFLLADSPARHRALSLAVDSAMQQAIDEVSRRMDEHFGDDVSRLQVPTSGGDDLVLILPAAFAFEAADILIREFEGFFNLQTNERLRDALGDEDSDMACAAARFGLGVGISVGRNRFPVRFLLRYARDLLKSSKGVLRRRPEVRSAVDFLVLRSGTPLSSDIEALRDHHDTFRPEHGEAVRLTQRPYSADDYRRVLAKSKALRQVPDSQVHAIRHELRKGMELSRSLWRYQHARAASGAGWARFRAAMECELHAIDQLLWLPADHGTGIRWSTDFLDAVDLYDYTGASSSGSSRRKEAA